MMMHKLLPTLLLLTSCVSSATQAESNPADAERGLDFLKSLKGSWVVHDDKDSPFGWEFDTTSRDGVVTERLKVGTPTEMASMYHVDGGQLIASHFCQLGNQPRLTAVLPGEGEDLTFLCNGNLAGADSHAELHMHGVHFKTDGDNVRIWMDMLEDGEVAFVTSYTLSRAE